MPLRLIDRKNLCIVSLVTCGIVLPSCSAKHASAPARAPAGDRTCVLVATRILQGIPDGFEQPGAAGYAILTREQRQTLLARTPDASGASLPDMPTFVIAAGSGAEMRIDGRDYDYRYQVRVGQAPDKEGIVLSLQFDAHHDGGTYLLTHEGICIPDSESAAIVVRGESRDTKQEIKPIVLIVSPTLKRA